MLTALEGKRPAVVDGWANAVHGFVYGRLLPAGLVARFGERFLRTSASR